MDDHAANKLTLIKCVGNIEHEYNDIYYIYILAWNQPKCVGNHLLAVGNCRIHKYIVHAVSRYYFLINKL